MLSFRRLEIPGRRVVAPPRRSALGYFVIALRGVRTIAPRGPGLEGAAQPRIIAMPQSGCHASTGPAMPRRNGPASKNRRAPKGQNMLAQGRARRRSRRAPPWVNGQRRASVALKGRDKCATDAPQTQETERRNDPNAGITRNATDSVAFVLHIEAHEFTPSIYLRFAMIVSTSGSRSCRAPSGR